MIALAGSPSPSQQSRKKGLSTNGAKITQVALRNLRNATRHRESRPADEAKAKPRRRDAERVPGVVQTDSDIMAGTPMFRGTGVPSTWLRT